MKKKKQSLDLIPYLYLYRLIFDPGSLRTQLTQVESVVSQVDSPIRK